jgi:hypothetical protein
LEKIEYCWHISTHFGSFQAELVFNMEAPFKPLSLNVPTLSCNLLLWGTASYLVIAIVKVEARVHRSGRSANEEGFGSCFATEIVYSSYCKIKAGGGAESRMMRGLE